MIKTINGRSSHDTRKRKEQRQDADLLDRWNIIEAHPVDDGIPIVFFRDVGSYNSLDILTREIIRALRIRGVRTFARSFDYSMGENPDKYRRDRVLLGELDGGPYVGVYVMADQETLKAPRDPQEILRVQIDAYDTFRIYKDDWVELYRNHVDVLATFSKWSAGEMDRHLYDGQETVLLPLGVDPEVWNRRSTPSRRGSPPPPRLQVVKANRQGGLEIARGKKVFLVVGMIQHRKGVDDIVKAYERAFHSQDDVLLWIHGRKAAWGNHKDLDLIAKGPPKIWTDGALLEEDLAWVYEQADVYVNASRMEGFGLGVLQALATGKVVVSVAAGGPMDFLTERNSILVPGTTAIAAAEGIPEEIPWETVDFRELSQALLDAKEEIDRGVLQVQAAEDAKGWSWSNSASHVLNILERAQIEPQKAQGLQGGLDILVPHKNAPGDAIRFVETISDRIPGIAFRIVMVDDYSDKGNSIWDAFEVARPEDPRETKKIRVGRCPVILANNWGRTGVPGARNTAWRISDRAWNFVADIDLDFYDTDEGWGKAMIDRMEEDKTIGILAPLLVYANGRVQSAGAVVKEDAAIPCKHRFQGQQVSDAVLQEALVPYAPAAAWMHRHNLTWEIGGMMEVFRKTSFDDVDWAYMVRETGRKVLYWPGVKIIHHEGSFRGQDRDSCFDENMIRWRTIWRPWEGRDD